MIFILFCLGLCLTVAAISDIRSLTIPNFVTISTVALYAVWALVLPVNLLEIGLSIAAGFLTFLIGLALFSRGVLGGGDVKLIAALGLWTGFHNLPRFLLVMAVSGGFLAIILLLAKTMRNVLSTRFAMPWSELWATKLPYGVAISVAGFDLIRRLAAVESF